MSDENHTARPNLGRGRHTEERVDLASIQRPKSRLGLIARLAPKAGLDAVAICFVAPGNPIATYRSAEELAAVPAAKHGDGLVVDIDHLRQVHRARDEFGMDVDIG